MAHFLKKLNCFVFVVTATGMLLTACQMENTSDVVLADGTGCKTDSDCTVTQPCVVGRCVADVCEIHPLSGMSCDDGNPCTTGTTCSEQGICDGPVQVTCTQDDNPCVEHRCGTENGQCQPFPAPDGPTSADTCHQYACAAGKEITVAELFKCPEATTPCIAAYTCDPTFTDPDTGSPCRPENQPNGTPCALDNGSQVIPASNPALVGQPSRCVYPVCYAENDGVSASCVSPESLDSAALEVLKGQGVITGHECTVEQGLTENVDFGCNDMRCACQNGDCSTHENTFCKVTPWKKEGAPCDTGNSCEIATCLAQDGDSLRCIAQDTISCDQSPETSCDQWLQCNPLTGGCPAVMLQEKSNANCHVDNPCVDNPSTECAPDKPDADPITGCVIAWLEVGAECTLAVDNACLLENLCLPLNDTELGCMTTKNACPPGGPCTILTDCFFNCNYTGLTGTLCDDEVPCTAESTCNEGQCVGVAAEGACDDANPCTLDTCSASHQGCLHKPIPGCESSFCTGGGEEGNILTCPIHMYRTDPSHPWPISARFVLDYNPSVLSITAIRVKSCNKKGTCQWIEVGTMPFGFEHHMSEVSPPDLNQWEGAGLLAIHSNLWLTPLSKIISVGSDFSAASQIAEVDVSLKVSVLEGSELPVGLLSAMVTDAEGGRLVGLTPGPSLELCQPESCPIETCSDFKTFPDGCGGDLKCPCTIACIPSGCDVALDLAPALRPPHSGDINNDGTVDGADAITYLQASVNKLTQQKAPPEQAFPDTCIDLNCDGLIDPMDVSRAQLLVVAEKQANWGLLTNDWDKDGIHDSCDSDDDNDNASDSCEWQNQTLPKDAKSQPPENSCASLQSCDEMNELCISGSDLLLIKEWDDSLAHHCVQTCPPDPNFTSCVQACFHSTTGLSLSCSLCHASFYQCATTICDDDACAIGSLGSCNACTTTHCVDAFYACTGIESDCEDDQDNNNNDLSDCEDPSCAISINCSKPVSEGPCSKEDLGKDKLEQLTDAALVCSFNCAGSQVFYECTEVCMNTATGLQMPCLDCFKVFASCSLSACQDPCGDADSPECDDCLKTSCLPDLVECAGITLNQPKACDNAGDLSVPFEDAFDIAKLCYLGCAWKPGEPNCLSACIVGSTALSVPCAGCYGNAAGCMVSLCKDSCKAKESDTCELCFDIFCKESFSSCAGKSVSID